MCQCWFSVKLMENEAENSCFGKKCFAFDRNSKKPTDLPVIIQSLNRIWASLKTKCLLSRGGIT